MAKEKRDSSIGKKIFSGLASLVFLAAPTITQAHSYWGNRSPIRNRTRHSPYAFNHKNPSGLISGSIDYNPYAFNHKNPSGLAPRDVRWSPYAFNHKHNGLIDKDLHTSHNSLFYSNTFPCYTIFSTCWPIGPPTKNKTQTSKTSTRKQNLAIQQKSKTPISKYAKEIYKYLSTNKISFTRKGEVFFLPNKKKIILSPGQNLINATEKYKTHIKNKWTINLLEVN